LGKFELRQKLYTVETHLLCRFMGEHIGRSPRLRFPDFAYPAWHRMGNGSETFGPSCAPFVYQIRILLTIHSAVIPRYISQVSSEDHEVRKTVHNPCSQNSRIKTVVCKHLLCKIPEIKS
jgi:hypothetical protein